MVPAVAVKLAEVAPDATFTEAGTVSAAALLESVTVIPPEPAACESVTEQAEVPPEFKVVGLQDTALTVIGATSEIDAVLELPFKVAVRTAVRLLGMVPAVAVKFVEVVPAATVTDAGTGSSPVLLERATIAPPADAGWFSVTVQVDDAPALSDVGLQESPVSVGNGTVMVPPVPVTGMEPPAGVAPNRLEIPTDVERAEVVIVTVTTAATPFCIVLSFIPASVHV